MTTMKSHSRQSGICSPSATLMRSTVIPRPSSTSPYTPTGLGRRCSKTSARIVRASHLRRRRARRASLRGRSAGRRRDVVLAQDGGELVDEALFDGHRDRVGGGGVDVDREARLAPATDFALDPVEPSFGRQGQARLVVVMRRVVVLAVDLAQEPGAWAA